MTTRKDVETRIVERAWSDEEFRQELLRHPKQVLEAELAEVFGEFRFPDGVTVSVVEESPEHLVLVLPVNPATESQELTEQEMDVISGGGGQPEPFGPGLGKGMGGFGVTVV